MAEAPAEASAAQPEKLSAKEPISRSCDVPAQEKKAADAWSECFDEDLRRAVLGMLG